MEYAGWHQEHLVHDLRFSRGSPYRLQHLRHVWFRMAGFAVLLYPIRSLGCYKSLHYLGANPIHLQHHHRHQERILRFLHFQYILRRRSHFLILHRCNFNFIIVLWRFRCFFIDYEYHQRLVCEYLMPQKEDTVVAHQKSAWEDCSLYTILML